MENINHYEVAVLVVLAALFGGFIREISKALFHRWTTDYLPRKDFEEWKKYVNNTFQRKDDHEFKKLFEDMEEIKRVLAIIAIKLNVDISRAHLTVSLEDIKEALNHESKAKDKN